MKIAIGVILLFLSVFTENAYANSYLQMLTTPPENASTESEEVDYFSDVEQSPNIKDDLWYNSRLITSAPVVVSSVPKYKAWLESQKYQYQYEIDVKECLQNALYIAEGALLVFGIYTLYKK